MEWAVCTSSCDSEDEVDQEASVDVAAESSTDLSQASIDLAFVSKAVSAKNGLASRDSVEDESEKKPPPKDVRDRTHFGKKDGLEVPVPLGMRPILTVNASEKNGVSYSASKVHKIATMSDEEEELFAQEALEEPAEEHHSPTAEFGVGWNQNPRSFAVQRKKRHFTEDGLGQASKLAKKSEPPQKSQMPGESAECGESSSDPAHRQWSPSLQGGQLEESYAAEELINCTQSTESSSPSSQEVQTGELKHSSPEFNRTYSNASPLKQHVSIQYIDGSKCPECKKWFAQADGMTQHRLMCHSIETAYQSSEYSYISRLHEHWKDARGGENNLVRHLVEIHSLQPSAHNKKGRYKCFECNNYFSKPNGLANHRIAVHNSVTPFQCTDCKSEFTSPSRLRSHKFFVHGPGKL